MSLKEFIDQKILEIKNVNLPINLFLLKHTSSKKPEKFFDIRRLVLREDADEHFKNLLKDELLKLSDCLKDDKIEDFFNESHNGVSTLPISQIDKLVKFTEEIKKFDSIRRVHNEKRTENIDAHAYKLELDDESEVIFFTRIPTGGKIKSKTGIIKDSKFRLVEDVLLIYKDQIDCIYFSDHKELLVLAKLEMEAIFKFDEYYKQKTIEVYEEKLQNKLISAPDELLEIIKQSPQVTKKMTRMEKEEKFNISVDELRKHMESLEENKERFTDQFKNYKSLQEEDGRYITKDKAELSVFLNACDKSVEIPLEQKDEDEPDIYLNAAPIKMTS